MKHIRKYLRCYMLITLISENFRLIHMCTVQNAERSLKLTLMNVIRLICKFTKVVVLTVTLYCLLSQILTKL